MKRFVLALLLVGCPDKQPPAPTASASASASSSASASASASAFGGDLADLLADGGGGPGSLSGLNGLQGSPGTRSAVTIPGTCVVGPTKASLPIADADRVMTTLRPRLERVYETNLQIDPNMEGTLEYDVKVTPTGEVGSVAGKPNGLSGATQGAMLQVIRSAHFAAPHGLSVLTGMITCKRKQ